MTVDASPRRYLGLELAGARNLKTTLAALEYFPRERKVFLLDIYEKIAPIQDESADSALIASVSEEASGGSQVARMGVSAPLVFPPCVACRLKHCPMPENCRVSTVKWMRKIAGRDVVLTPYTQGASEIWVKHRVFPELPEAFRFDIDEALGGNRAPLTARMAFLSRHWQKTEMIEVWPKLTVAILVARIARKSGEASLLAREYRRYRKPEEGALARQRILQRVTETEGIFVYERDLQKLAANLGAFDAFFCAYTALLSDLDACEPSPKGLGEPSLRYPKLGSKTLSFARIDTGGRGGALERDAVQ